MLRRSLTIQRRRYRQRQQQQRERSPSPVVDEFKPGLLRGQVEAWRTNLVARYHRRDTTSNHLAPPKQGIYHPLDQTQSEIRILIILPSTHRDSTVCCTIETQTLELAASIGYDALSYCWGSSTTSAAADAADDDGGGTQTFVLINDIPKPVTLNLEHALRCLRHDQEVVRVWADALCINQSDTRERNHQVGTMMREIYRRAGVVRVSLNDDSGDHDDEEGLREGLRAVERVRERRGRWQRKNAYTPAHHEGGMGERIGAGEGEEGGGVVRFVSPWTEGFDVLSSAKIGYGDGDGDAATSGEQQQNHNMLGLSEADVRSLANFFAHPWWSRIWVVQEVHLAEICEIHVGGGGGDLPAVRFSDATRAAERLWNVLDSLESTDQKITGLDLPHLRKITASAKAFLRILAVCNLESGDRGSLVRILSEARALLATDPRDQVFGLIGLSEHLEKVEPDYSLTPERTFIRASAKIMKATESLDVLHLAGLELNGSSSVPSWVPDWTIHHAGQSSRHISVRNLYLAAGHSSPCMEIRKIGELAVKSVLVDVIGKTTTWPTCDDQPEYLHDLLASIYENCLAVRGHSSNLSKISESTLEEDVMIGMRTIAMDVVRSEGPLQRGFDSAVRHYELQNRIKQMLSGTFDINIEPTTQDEPRSMRRFLKDELIPNARGQFLGNTKAGRICLVPTSSRPGDTIQIIAGFSMPVVMRPCDRSKFQLVGVCYLDQMMDNIAVGQCLRLPGSSKLHPFKTTVLI